MGKIQGGLTCSVESCQKNIQYFIGKKYFYQKGKIDNINLADISNNSISLIDQDYTNSTFGVARNTRVGNFRGSWERHQQSKFNHLL